MIKNDFSRGVELYSAPELEVISTIVEGGFSLSNLEEEDMGEF